MAKKKNTPKKTVKETTKKSFKKNSPKAAKKTSKKTVKKAAKKTLKQSPKKSAKKTSKKTVKKAAKKTLKQSPKKSAKKTVKKTLKKTTPQKSGKSAKKQSKSVAKTPAQKTQQTQEKFTPHVTSLKPGMLAPYWEGVDQNGNKITSNDLLGRKYVLYFYPKDHTPGCTDEACNIRDNYQKFLNAGISVYGVSADSTKSHQSFIEKFQLPFPLIADTEKNIIRAFDVWGKKQFMGKIMEGIIRTTFVIDENGIISDVITKVDTKNHTEQILK